MRSGYVGNRAGPETSLVGLLFEAHRRSGLDVIRQGREAAGNGMLQGARIPFALETGIVVLAPVQDMGDAA